MTREPLLKFFKIGPVMKPRLQSLFPLFFMGKGRRVEREKKERELGNKVEFFLPAQHSGIVTSQHRHFFYVEISTTFKNSVSVLFLNFHCEINYMTLKIKLI